MHAGGVNLFLGRQPILDHRQELFAFELLFRSDRRNAASFDHDVTATATVISNAINELGLESVLGRYRGFINLSEALLMSDMIELLPKDKVVLEVLETVRPTPQVAARCAELNRMGFSLALDDVVSADEAFEPLLPLVKFIKIDLTGAAAEALPRIAHRFRSSGVSLLAEKVDMREQVDRCLELGFSYFQGYYFAKPEIISGKKLNPSKLVLLDLLRLVLGDADLSTIEQVLKREPALSINLLRLANSVANGLRHRVDAIGAAVMMLGRRQLQRWVQLLLYSTKAGSDAPSPLMQLAVTRGRTMELLANHVLPHKGAADQAFLTGIMSLMETLLQRPLPEILSTLPLSAEVNTALLERDGRLGQLLTLCECIEEADPRRIWLALADLPELTVAALNKAHADALRWANNIGEPAG
jgi:c-di-GMP-related signal transduction protein